MPELDTLRGLAALAIVVFHSNPNRLPFGWAAVDLFFVLSGYLITGIILRHGATPGFLLRFYLRRGLRVWPIYYLVVLAVAAAGPLLPRAPRWEGLPLVLTFTQGVPLYWQKYAPMFSLYLGHAWSLAIEEQFYLLWPAVVLLVGRRWVVGLALAWAVGSAAARGSGLPISLLGARGDGLALGGLLAAILARVDDQEGRARLARVFVGIAGAALVGLGLVRVLGGAPPRPASPPPWPGLTILGFNVLWFGVVGFTACRAGAPALAWMRRNWLRRLGTVSYGLYLYHFPILLLSIDLANRVGYRGRQLYREVPTVALCFVAAGLSWVLVERPVLRWKDRFEYRGTTPAQMAGVVAHPAHDGPAGPNAMAPSVEPARERG